MAHLQVCPLNVTALCTSLAKLKHHKGLLIRICIFKLTSSNALLFLTHSTRGFFFGLQASNTSVLGVFLKKLP